MGELERHREARGRGAAASASCTASTVVERVVVDDADLGRRGNRRTSSNTRPQLTGGCHDVRHDARAGSASSASARDRARASAPHPLVEVDLARARSPGARSATPGADAEVLEQQEQRGAGAPSRRSPRRRERRGRHARSARSPRCRNGSCASIWCSARYSGSFIGLLTSSVVCGIADLHLAIDALLQVVAERLRRRARADRA